MVDANQHHQQKQVLQPVLVLGPPLIFEHFESQYSHKYTFLKAFASSLPIEQFLETHRVDPTSIRAILCNPFQRVSAEVLRLLPSLGIVVTSSIGTDHIDLAECYSRRVQVATAGGLFSEDVADLAVGLLIDVLRKISAGDRYVRRRVDEFQPWNYPLGSKVGGKRVGIVGLGKIGILVARRLEAFGCRVVYNSRKEKAFVSYPFYSNVVDLAADSDALVLCCPLTEQTYHMVNREVMLALGKEGVIVNIGRGALIDEKELVQCLMEGKIGGTGLDVFENEPNVPKELFELDNVVLSPHAAALTLECFNSTCEDVARNLEAFFSSQPLVSPIMDA
ncbi:hypothetical protein L6164_003763 [Bauhinia variegata]|uniref:Uncharacterized protein n=1 Tax=Bauhinia variegata TaxID=167791 RepID=A0ACB9Q1Q7_BAUVA|nr:hypothetical protein L6164_003763 [Bauhinia variegata]